MDDAGDKAEDRVLCSDSADCTGFLIVLAGILQHCRCIFFAALPRFQKLIQVDHL